MAKKAKTTAKKKTKRKTRKKSEPEPQEVWQELTETVDVDAAQKYSMAGTFQPNTAIEHPKFGLGVVTAALNHKIEVTFEDGARSLVHNRK